MTAARAELIVIAHEDAALRAVPSGLTSLAGNDTEPLNDICRRYGGTMRPLFGASEDRILREAAQAPSHVDAPDLSVYYRVETPGETPAETLHDIAATLLAQPLVAGAYVKPPPEPATVPLVLPPRAEEPPAATPDFSGLQGYRGPAPGGVDVARAWALNGGRGAGVRIIDIEGAWRFTHEDLTGNQGGVLAGTQNTELDSRDHGTAVLGVVGGDDNGFGVVGLCPDANVSAISWQDIGTASAINTAAARLDPGDIILVEIHSPGPRFGFTARDDQLGYIAVEFWPDDFDAIRFATRVRGVIVVEAAGNGAENLDDQLYDARPAGFPEQWRNPFRRGDRDSDAILVGAGAPPPGTHGRDHGPDRSRLEFSNYGSAVDAQGWGREVATCGYGSLQGGANEDLWYTDQFNGTSSASPIIVGVLACLQGRRRALGRSPLTPRAARDLLGNGGSFQQDAPGRPSTQNIGSRPDLRVLVGIEEGAAVKAAKDATDKGFEKPKDKEGKDTEEKKVKEGKDPGKDSKEKEHKDSKEKEHKDAIAEKAPHDELAKAPEVNTFGAGAAKNIDDRLAGLEQAVARLAHFIGPELRPDLSASALSGEPVGATGMLAEQLRRQAQQARDAKDAKDAKDTEQPTYR